MFRKTTILVLTLFAAGCASNDRRHIDNWAPCAIVGAAAGAALSDDENVGGAALGATVGALLCTLAQQRAIDADGDGVLDGDDRCPNTPRAIKVNPLGCPVDSDGDGVSDHEDQCGSTPANAAVDPRGCPLDSDGDGIADVDDACPASAAGTKVDARGCALDSDGDGVVDTSDQCPKTPAGTAVNVEGCPLDADRDGVADTQDACANTPPGVAVDARGCPRDSDGDGVDDVRDACAGTAAGAQVDARGCIPAPPKTLVLKGVEFLSNSAELTLPSLTVLAGITQSLQDNPDAKVEIGGHTDSRGAAEYNEDLSRRRAQAVREFLINRGIDPARLRVRGYGESQPIADNDTAEGRKRNRRVELKRID